MSFSDLPAVNACLNGLSAVFLTTGYIFIRRKNQRAHHRCMISALITSAIFLTCYVIYHSQAGRTIFKDPAWFRPIYLTLLLTHTTLAVTVLPLAIITLSRALKQRFDFHKRIARWTWPIWMYVSVTGVLIYLLLYHIFPQRKLPNPELRAGFNGLGSEITDLGSAVNKSGRFVNKYSLPAPGFQA